MKRAGPEYIIYEADRQDPDDLGHEVARVPTKEAAQSESDRRTTASVLAWAVREDWENPR